MDVFSNVFTRLIGIVYLTVNLILLYLFLTPKRSLLFQIIAFLATFVVVHFFIPHPEGLYDTDFILKAYLLGTLYLIPCLLVFQEKTYAKIFVFFMNYTLTQFVFLILLHIVRLVGPSVPSLWVLAGLLIEAAFLPLIRKKLKSPLSLILELIDSRYPAFTLFPILSFLLLAHFALTGEINNPAFVTLTLSAALIFYSYYLIGTAIKATRRESEFEQISNSDSLTGVSNRRHMERLINDQLQHFRKTGIEFSLIIADIDHFKSINDTYGHDNGDVLLVEVVNKISSSVRNVDTVSRWGGEEFLLLLPSTGRENAFAMAERIRKKISHHAFIIGSARLNISLTLGVSVIRTDDTSESIIKRADTALYSGKRSSRNCSIISTE